MKLLRCLSLSIFLIAPAALADAAFGVRFGTLGIGADVDFGLTETLTLRVGYSGLSYSDTLDDTDVTYDGNVELSNPFAFFDWHAFDGTFRFTFGALGGNSSIDAVGKPTGGTYQIGDATFPASAVGTLRGRVELGNSIAPYVGIGWGRAVGGTGRFAFLADLGAAYGGEPDVHLTANCGPAAPPGSAACLQLQREVQREEDELANDANEFKWYPVVSLGFAVRF